MEKKKVEQLGVQDQASGAVFPDFPEPIPEEPEKKEEKSEIVVDPEVAGDLIRIPFELVNVFIPAWEPLTDSEVERIKSPFARCLQKWGLGKISRDEVVLGFYLAIAISSRIRKISSLKVKKNEKYSFFGCRKEGDGKNDTLSGPDQKI